MVLSPGKRANIKLPGKEEQPPRKNSTGVCKLQRGPKPLKDKRFYLDFKNHSASTKLENTLRSFGAIVDPFIGQEVDFVVTDRPEWGGTGSQSTVGSPSCTSSFFKPSPSPAPLPSIFSPAASPAGNSRGSNISPAFDSPGDNSAPTRRQSRSRAEAMLDRVRLQPQVKVRDPLTDAQKWNIPVWTLEKVLKLLERIQQSLSKGSVESVLNKGHKHSKAAEPTQKVKFCRGKHFLKLEPIDRKCRPSFKDLPSWPRLNLDTDPGTSPFVSRPAAAKCTPKKNVTDPAPPKTKACVIDNSNSRLPPGDSKAITCSKRPAKSPVRGTESKTAKQELIGGYCEVCKLDYTDLYEHIATPDHRNYSRDSKNYASLDAFIDSKSLYVNDYLKYLVDNPEDNCSTSSSRHCLPEAGSLRPRRLQSADSAAAASTARSPSPLPTERIQRIQRTHADSSATPLVNDANMRQSMDDRHLPPKMVGRKDSLEVHCNGLSNHVQTRFACTKGDRENLGGLFFDERLPTAQLRRRRAISVSCRDLLQLSTTNNEHFLRSSRGTRSELSQLSPALSDNSHPLLNSNNQQPLLSPTLSEKSHCLRPRGHLWLSTGLLDEDAIIPRGANGKVPGSLLVTANHCHLDKAVKCERVDKEEADRAESDREDKVVKQDGDRDRDRDGLSKSPKGPRGSKGARGRSIRRKRLSAEEKLIEDNRGYYKVEVLNSKLRSTGYYVSQIGQGQSAASAAPRDHDGDEEEEAANDRLTSDGGEGAQGMKEPVVVRFKKVRRSELSVLSDEAENFMFGEPTRSDSNSDSSEYDEDEDEDEEDDEADGRAQPGDDVDEDEPEEAPVDEEASGSSRGSRGALRRGRNHVSREPSVRRLRLKLDSLREETSSGTSNGLRRHRRRRTQTNDAGAESESESADPSASKDAASTTVPDNEWREDESETLCSLDKLHFSFESVPRSEVWFQTFQRQDRCEEVCFPFPCEPSGVLLPYQLPRRTELAPIRPMMLKRRRRNRFLAKLPRKSPRCHASTLAMLSSRSPFKSSEESPTAGVESPALATCSPAAKAPSSAGPTTRKVLQSQSALAAGSESRTCGQSSDFLTDSDPDMREIAKNVDSMLGITGDPVEQPKGYGRGRWKKKAKVEGAGSWCSSGGAGAGAGTGTGTGGGGGVGTGTGPGAGLVTSPGQAEDGPKDPALNYLVDPALLEELACTCDVVANPLGGPSVDIVALLDSYASCGCFVGQDNVDASCNSSECGASSTCDVDRRARKKRKRRNMTGWDKPKKKGLRREVVTGEASARGTPAASADADAEVDADADVGAGPDRSSGRKRKFRRDDSSSSADSPRAVSALRRGRGGVVGGFRNRGRGRGAVKRLRLSSERDKDVVITPRKRGRTLGWRKAR